MKRHMLIVLLTVNLFANDNHILNGSLDKGLHNWVIWGARYSKDSRKGKGAVSIVNKDPKWSGMHQVIPVPSGASKLIVNGWMKTENVEQGAKPWEKAKIGLEYLDACSNLLESYPTVPGESIGTSDWIKYYREYSLNPEVRNIKIICALGNVKGQAWFDDINVNFVDDKENLIFPSKCIYDRVNEDYAIPENGKQVAQITNSGIKYYLYLPENYNADKKWPLVIFLHGMGERGDCLKKLEMHGPPTHTVAEGGSLPFILVSPLCPIRAWWADSLVEPVFQDVIKKFSIDQNRISITGLSMGGFGVMAVATAHPDRFAAILPIAGGFNLNDNKIPENICDLSKTSAWFIHGKLDNIILYEKSQILVNALMKCGATPKFTLYPDADHVASFKRAYADPEIYNWLNRQVRKK